MKARLQYEDIVGEKASVISAHIDVAMFLPSRIYSG